MRLLITGGTGCLGASIAEKYLALGVPVLAIDNFTTSSRDSLAPHKNLKLVEGDIVDAVLMTRLFDEFKPTHVVHAAASYKNPDDWSGDVATNVSGTVNVAREALRYKVERFIYLQTALTYGRPLEKPVTISHRLAPFTSYSISKTAGENYVAMSGLPWVSLRLANIYGPRHFSGPIPTFYKRLKAGQNCVIADTRRDFMAMEDFLDLIDLIFKSDITGPFNVSSGRDHSIQEIFDLIASHLGIELEKPPELVSAGNDDVASLLLDPSETEKQFGWRAKMELEEGLARQISWFEDNGVGATYTHLAIGSKG